MALLHARAVCRTAARIVARRLASARSRSRVGVVGPENVGREDAADQLIRCRRRRHSRAVHLRWCGCFARAGMDRAARRHTEPRTGRG